jgi:hypothetical protein
MCWERSMKRWSLASAAQCGLSTILLVYSAMGYCGSAVAKWAAAHGMAMGLWVWPVGSGR